MVTDLVDRLMGKNPEHRFNFIQENAALDEEAIDDKAIDSQDEKTVACYPESKFGMTNCKTCEETIAGAISAQCAATRLA